MTPQEACGTFGRLVNNGEAAISLATANQDWCQIPPSFIEGMKTDNAKVTTFRGQARNAVKQQAAMEKRARQQAQGANPFGGADSSPAAPVAACACRRARSERAKLPCRAEPTTAAITGGDAPLPDALTDHWADTRAPRVFRPFLKLARIERPIGWWLLPLPCWWAAGLAAIAAGRLYPDPRHVLLFLIGAIVMRGAGCTFNDIIDRKLDAQVARTRGPPRPSGCVTAKAAALFMIGLSLTGFVVLLQFNSFTIWLGIASLAIVAIYLFLKRVTNMLQFALGLAFPWGGLLGWSAALRAARSAGLSDLRGCGRLDRRLRHDLRDAGHRGRRHRRHQVERAISATTREAVALCFTLTLLLSGLAIWLVGGGFCAWAGFTAFAAHLGWQVVRIPGATAPEALKLFRPN